MYINMNLVIKKPAILLTIACCLATLTYIHRYPTGDDAWFAEQSYWLQKEGIIRSEFFTGVLGWDKHLLVSHKLFLGIGAVFIKLFGYGLPTVQFVGLVFFYLFIVEICIYITQIEGRISSYLFVVLILIFLSTGQK